MILPLLRNVTLACPCLLVLVREGLCSSNSGSSIVNDSLLLLLLLSSCALNRCVVYIHDAWLMHTGGAQATLLLLLLPLLLPLLQLLLLV
jgi:hypothetical protein